MSYFETNTGNKFNIFGQGGGDALAEQFALPMLGKFLSVKTQMILQMTGHR